MKDILKNKLMIVFVTLILGMTYIQSTINKKMEENTITEEKQFIVMNIQ